MSDYLKERQKKEEEFLIYILEKEKKKEKEKEKEEFLKTFPTLVHCKRQDHLWVFWSQHHHHHEIQHGFQINNNNNNNDSFSADVDTQRRRTISDKIKDAFSMLKSDYYFDPLIIIQFWALVTTIGGRPLLSTSGQPFAVISLSKHVSKYRLCCVECHNDDVNNNNKQPTATAFLNRLPQAVFFKSLKGVSPTPLVDSALECGLETSCMLPVCCPSQSTSCCIGVVEFSTHSISFKDPIIAIIRALEEVGLGVFQLQECIPSQIISGLKPAKSEIEDVLKIVCKSNDIALAQVWIPFEDHNHVSFSSYLEGTRNKQMLSLKLMGYLAHTDSGIWWDKYCGLCDMFPLEMGGDFVEKTLEDYKPRFCNDVSKLSGDTWVKITTVFCDEKFSRLAICLNSIHTGAFRYAFDFIWEDDPDSDDVEFVEELLLTLKKLLPSFKLASGAELGDELDFIKVGDSTATKTKFLKIFQGKKLSPIPEVLEEGTRIPVPMVVDYIAPLEAKYKTTPIPLSREVIEQQFGNTETEAAENLKVSRSTLRCNFRKHGILKWKGRNKRKVNDLYSNQSDTNEEDTGTNQEPLPVNRNEHTLTIKAEYAGDMIKFCFHIFQATFQNVMEEIGTRFKLTPGTYKVKYLDEDKDWILLTSEQDISDCIKTPRNSDRTAVRLRVEPSA